ncbi:hypothetical protein L596_019574 [Steinernema carpocapsae]|uniref:Aminopeptidase N-like N-terminal domain-containing protein n=1 Tax=Steinernema carpocapsae TaxID=34508 RepID=A0A4U5MQX9_STECR|nr:hypothetical protein L596_019574 [Steinernema carpocapsae]
MSPTPVQGPQRRVQWKELSKKTEILYFFYCDGRIFCVWFFITMFASLAYAVILYFALLNRTPYAPDPDSIPYIFVPSRYNLSLRIDTSRDDPKQTFSGTVFIRFRSLVDTAALFLHLGHNVEVHEAALFPVELSRKNYRVARKRHNPKTEILTIVLNRNITKLLDYNLELKFAGSFRSDDFGPKIFSYNTLFGEERYGALYVNPETATKGLRYLIPCLDSSQYPAEFFVNVRRPGVMRSLSNSARIKTLDIPGDKEYLEDSFNQTIILFPYQLMVVVCDFQYKREFSGDSDLEISAYFRPSIIQEVSVERLVQFMDPKSNQIGKIDAVVIPNIKTVNQPGISVLNEAEAIEEARVLEDIEELREEAHDGEGSEL